MSTVKTLATYKQAMEDAWKEVERTSPTASNVRNCLSDSDANYHAVRAYQGARATYLEQLSLASDGKPANSTPEDSSYHEQ
jgi:methylthioribose-1-phosphate isomerase